MIKRCISLFFVFSIIALPLRSFAAENIPNMNTQIKNLEDSKIKKEKYKYKTVLKYFIPYEAVIINNNKSPLTLTTESEVEFITADGSIIKSLSRREIYKRTRKRDIGRYYSVTLPGAAIAGGITGITFFILAPVGVLIAAGTFETTNKAVRTNVDISQEIYKSADLPIRFETSKSYPVRFYIPKKIDVKAIRITNLSLDNKNGYELVIPVNNYQEGQL